MKYPSQAASTLVFRCLSVFPNKCAKITICLSSLDKPLNSFLDKVRDCIVTFLVRYNQMAQVCDKPISLEALNDCLDLEKFEFAMANILIDLTKIFFNIHLPLLNLLCIKQNKFMPFSNILILSAFSTIYISGSSSPPYSAKNLF